MKINKYPKYFVINSKTYPSLLSERKKGYVSRSGARFPHPTPPHSVRLHFFDYSAIIVLVLSAIALFLPEQFLRQIGGFALIGNSSLIFTLLLLCSFSWLAAGCLVTLWQHLERSWRTTTAAGKNTPDSSSSNKVRTLPHLSLLSLSLPSAISTPSTDEQIERWGEIFVKHRLRESLGVEFEQFLQAPRTLLQGGKRLSALILRIKMGITAEDDVTILLNLLNGQKT